MKLRNKKVIIAIMSCVKNRPTKQQSVLNTWISKLPNNIEWFFFEGSNKENYDKEKHKLLLECSDSYIDLALKSHTLMTFCISNLSFDYLLKVDDDTLVHIDRLLNTELPESDYIGNGSGIGHDFAQGGAYLLSYKAVKSISEFPFESGKGSRWWYGGQSSNSNWTAVTEEVKSKASVEDMMIGDILKMYDIRLTNIVQFLSHIPYTHKYKRMDTLSKINKSNIISFHPFNHNEMIEYYQKM